MISQSETTGHVATYTERLLLSERPKRDNKFRVYGAAAVAAPL